MPAELAVTPPRGSAGMRLSGGAPSQEQEQEQQQQQQKEQEQEQEEEPDEFKREKYATMRYAEPVAR